MRRAGRPQEKRAAFRVWEAEDGDLLDVLRLCAESARFHAELQPRFFRADGSGRRLPTRGAGRAVLLAGRVGEAPVGLAAVTLHETPVDPLLQPARRVHVEELIVSRSARRSGCGRELVEAVRTWARRAGAEQLVLTVWDGNSDAERFYAALGFSTVSRVLASDV